MLVMSLLFITVAVLFVFSLTRDTGKHTKHARKDNTLPAQFNQETSHTVDTSEIIEAN